jgi:HD-GYP domain-containing protein (c-di-GMP phosphodiesterase class II)
MGPSGVRLADIVSALALATDLGIGQPMEHVLRQTAAGLRIGDRLGIGASERAAVCHVGMLAWVGCTADSHELAKWFGDDIVFRADSYSTDLAGLSMFGFMVRHLGAGEPALRRARIAASLLAGGFRQIEESMRSHCELAADFAARLGLPPDTQAALRQVFERWDGKGSPGRLRGDQISPAVRIVHLADIVEVFHRAGGVDAAVAVARERSGKLFDPSLVDAFCSDASGVLAGLDELGSWDALIDAEPALARELDDGELDACLAAVADFVDLKSPYTAGHSRGVARLAADAAGRLGLPASDAERVRRAGLLHDIGRVGVPNTIWDKPGPLTQAELERVRLHAYLTERTLARAPALAHLGAIAALHHERCDGSGYHKGLRADALPALARVLAAADAYHAMLEPRPHRDALAADAAGAELRADVRRGLHDGAAVEAVLAAAGHRVRRRPEQPAGLTPRELEVLAMLARGSSNRDIARVLHISPKTAGNHVEHIYTKIGVSSRAGATLFATRHGLLDVRG